MKRILNSKRPHILAAVFTLGSFGMPAWAAAGNFLANGSFDSDISGWAADTSVSWSDQGSSGRGAARVSGSPGIVGKPALSQCAGVEHASEYSLGASVLIPYSRAATGGASLRVTWFGAPECGAEPLGMAPSVEFPFLPAAAWTRRSLERLRAPSGAVSALVSVLVYSGGSPGAFEMVLDDISLTPAPRYETVTIPTAAAVDGGRGERFQTSLILTNPTPFERRIETALFCQKDENCGSSLISLHFNPGETRVFGDVMLEIFGKRNFAGALTIGYDASIGPIVASARAATVHAGRPGNGMMLPVLPSSAAVTSGLFTGLVESRGGPGAVRVNAGVFNPHDAYVWVGFGVYGEDGIHVNTVYRYAAPREWFQINDIFTAASAGTATPASTVRVTSEAPVYPFLISIDNRSGDPTWIELKEDFQP